MGHRRRRHASEPEVPAKVELGAASVKAGGTVTVSGSGFAEGAQLRFELRSDPVQLGTATAGTDGSFQRTLTIPANTPAGAHTLAVIRADGTEITTSLTVTAQPVVATQPRVRAPEGRPAATSPRPAPTARRT